MNKIIGIKHSSGTFDSNGRDVSYNNMILYLITDSDRDTFGLSGSEIKIKCSNFPAVTGYDCESASELVNKQVALSYGLINDKPVLDTITVIPDKPEKSSPTTK